jgi:NADH-quinone oxidoreductase subunit N
MAGGSPEADGELLPERRGAGAVGEPVGAVRAGDGAPGASRRVRQPEVAAVALVCALATLALGIYPGPLFDVARDAGGALTTLL